jgi:hypothetical protein
MQGIPYVVVCYCKYLDPDHTFNSKKETAIFGSIENFAPCMCNIEQGQCVAKRHTGKHPDSIGNALGRKVSRVDRLRIPRGLCVALLDSML